MSAFLPQTGLGNEVCKVKNRYVYVQVNFNASTSATSAEWLVNWGGRFLVHQGLRRAQCGTF